MFRFTIRDVLWLTVVVALGVGWGVSNRTSSQRYDKLYDAWVESEIDRQMTHQYWDGAQDAMKSAGIEWPKPVWTNAVRVESESPATPNLP